MPANTFDNVKGQFPIGFFIWDSQTKETFDSIKAKVYDYKRGEVIPLGYKTLYSYKGIKRITPWINHYSPLEENVIPPCIGMLNTGRTDFQNQSLVRIAHEQSDKGHSVYLDRNNLVVASVFLAVRHCIARTWLNDRDQFLYPTDGWQWDSEFQSDCLAYTLFHGQNRITMTEGVNHWIPFSYIDIGAKEAPQSDFMVQFLRGELRKPTEQPKTALLFTGEDGDAQSTSFATGQQKIKFSEEAQAVFDAGRELWCYYHEQQQADPNAALYDIKAHFQGRNEEGRMRSTSDDSTYNRLLKKLNQALAHLASEKIVPKVYAYRFLLP